MARNVQAAQQQQQGEGEDREPELIMVDDRGARIADNEDAQVTADDASLSEAAEGGGEDERLSTTDEGVAEDARHSRETSRERRLRHQRSRDRNRTELRFLQQRNEELERRFSEIETRTVGSEVQHLTAQIAKLQSDIALADQVIANAINSDPAQNPKRGEDVAEALRIRDQLREQLGQLTTNRERANATVTQMRDQRQAPAAKKSIDARVKQFAADWAKDNSWYDPEGGDEDSAIALALDNILSKEGYDPRTPAYWKELSRRVQTRLPHLFEAKGQEDAEDNEEDLDELDEDEASPVRKATNGASRRETKSAPARGGPRLTVRGQERTLKKNEVHISEARKQALMDSGAWDDPVLRKKYIKAYQRYDQQARAGGGQ